MEPIINGLDPLNLVVRLAGFVVAISVHEFFHAFTAWRLGDYTAKDAGRLTLNPLRHLDPFGSILLLVAGFGWGKPVPVNPRNLRHGRLGMALVSAAGPLSNFATALIMAAVIVGVFPTRAQVALHPTLFAFVVGLTGLSIGLGLFNLLPIAPLDGFGVAVGVLPWTIARPLARLGQYGPGILMLLVFLPYIVHIDVLGFLLGPLREFTLDGMLRIAYTVLHGIGVR